MNALFVTYHYLYGNGGGVYASRAYINALSEIVDSLDLIYPMKSGMEPSEISKKVKLIPAYYNKPKFLKLLDLLTGTLHRHEALFLKTLKEKKYNLVVFDTSQAAWRLIDAAKEHGAKVIVIHHNFEQEYILDNYSGFMKLIQMYWVTKYEKQSVLKSDLNLTLTKDDMELLRDFYDKQKCSKFEVLGVFEYKKSQRGTHTKEEMKNNNFVITGSLGAVQTYESLKKWIKEYYPILLKKCNDAVLTIAGKSPSHDLIKMCEEKNISLVPSPPSMDDILLNAKYYICPISLGGGLKLRIMDGLKAGLPVLTHEVSLRGYEMFKDEFVIGYHNEESFARGVDKLLNLDYDSQTIQTKFSDCFSFLAGKERFEEILKRFDLL